MPPLRKKKRAKATGRMHHLILVESRPSKLAKPLPREDETYVRNVVLPVLEPLKPLDYVYGPAGILETLARYSYVVHGADVLWCVEWDPGLLVVRFSPNGQLAWAALRSPNPEFGGRRATKRELDAFDEDAHNPQYTLVFRAWDAALDDELRRGWSPAVEIGKRWSRAIEPANALLEKTFGERGPSDWWLRRCKKSPIWRGLRAMS